MKYTILYITFFLSAICYCQKRTDYVLNLESEKIIYFQCIENVAMNIREYESEYVPKATVFMETVGLLLDKIKHRKNDVFQIFFYLQQNGEKKVLINHLDKSLKKKLGDELELVFYLCTDGCRKPYNFYTLYEIDLKTSRLIKLSH